LAHGKEPDMVTLKIQDSGPYAYKEKIPKEHL
jgi:hypothetical protein